MTDERVKGFVLPPCPFCGKTVAYTRDDNGEPNGLLHALPMCEKFEQLDPLDFVREARNKMQTDRGIS